jgi:hypothetical protein
MLYVTVTRSVSADANTILTADFFNLLGTPIIEIKGTVDGSGSITLSDGSVTTAKLADASAGDNGVTKASSPTWRPARSRAMTELGCSPPRT